MPAVWVDRLLITKDVLTQRANEAFWRHCVDPVPYDWLRKYTRRTWSSRTRPHHHLPTESSLQPHTRWRESLCHYRRPLKYCNLRYHERLDLNPLLPFHAYTSSLLPVELNTAFSPPISYLIYIILLSLGHDWLLLFSFPFQASYWVA